MRHSVKIARVMGLVAIACFVSGCGPTAFEIGAAVLGAAPIGLFAMCLPTALLQKMRDRHREVSVEPSGYLPLALAWAIAASACIIGVYLTFPGGGDEEVLLMAALATGWTGLFTGQIGWLLFDARKRGRAFGRFTLPTLLVLQIIPAFGLLIAGPLGMEISRSDAQGIALALWVVPGLYFVPGTLLFLILLAVYWHISSKDREQTPRSNGEDGSTSSVADIMS